LRRRFRCPPRGTASASPPAGIAGPATAGVHDRIQWRFSERDSSRFQSPWRYSPKQCRRSQGRARAFRAASMNARRQPPAYRPAAGSRPPHHSPRHAPPADPGGPRRPRPPSPLWLLSNVRPPGARRALSTNPRRPSSDTPSCASDLLRRSAISFSVRIDEGGHHEYRPVPVPIRAGVLLRGGLLLQLLRLL
jgi:hypothetical protein